MTRHDNTKPQAGTDRSALRDRAADLKPGLARARRRPQTADIGPSRAPDPILAAIEASRRIEAQADALDDEHENDLADEQGAAREAAFAIVPATWAGLQALAGFADFHVSRTIGPKWRAEARQDYYGEALLALVNAIQAERPEEPGDIERDAASDAPATVEQLAALDFEACAFDHALRSPDEWSAETARYALGLHLADRLLRMTKPEMSAFITEAGKGDADAPAAMFQMLDATREVFEDVGRRLAAAHARFVIGGSDAIGREA